MHVKKNERESYLDTKIIIKEKKITGFAPK